MGSFQRDQGLRYTVSYGLLSKGSGLRVKGLVWGPLKGIFIAAVLQGSCVRAVALRMERLGATYSTIATIRTLRNSSAKNFAGWLRGLGL